MKTEDDNMVRKKTNWWREKPVQEESKKKKSKEEVKDKEVKDKPLGGD